MSTPPPPCCLLDLTHSSTRRATLPCVKKSTTQLATGSVVSTIVHPIIHRPTITKRALAARKSRRDRTPRSTTSPDRMNSVRPSLSPVSSNYAPRVLAGQFEPTALRARQIASDRGQSLHELAYELGYASAPPRVRTQPVDLSAHTRTEIAAATGYDVSDISRLFARRHPPTLTKLAKVAAVYDVWLDDMLTALGW